MTGLFALFDHEVDDVLIEQLSASDPQLLLTVAQRLQGSHQGMSLLQPALDALARLSLGRRDTHRDPRMELLRRIAEFGAISDMSRPPLWTEAAAAPRRKWVG